MKKNLKLITLLLLAVLIIPNTVKALDTNKITTLEELITCLNNKDIETICVLNNDIEASKEAIKSINGGNRIFSLGKKHLYLNGKTLNLNDSFISNNYILTIRDEDENGNKFNTGKITGTGDYLIYTIYDLNIYSGTYDGSIIKDEKVSSQSYHEIHLYGGNYYSKIYVTEDELHIHGGNYYGEIYFDYNRDDRLNWLKISGGYFSSNNENGKTIRNGNRVSHSKLNTVATTIIKETHEIIPNALRMPTSDYIYLPKRFVVLEKITGSWNNESASWNKINNTTKYILNLYKDSNIVTEYSNLELSSDNEKYNLKNIIQELGTGNYKFDIKACYEDLCGSINESAEKHFDVYNVSYNTSGGSNIESINLLPGTIINEPNNPTKKGYVFNGWYNENTLDTKFNFNNEINEDTIIYAGWIPITITLNKNNISIFKTTYDKIEATINPTNKIVNKKVEWKSSNNNIVTIDKNGYIYGNSVGTATIYASYDGVTTSTTITVKDIPIDSISLNSSSIVIEKGKSTNLVPTILPINTTLSKSLKWISTDSNIVSVDQNGNITANNIGIAKVYAETINGKSIYCDITVTRINAESLNYTNIVDKKYTGKYIKQNVHISYKDQILVLNKDYTVKYVNNKKVGVSTIEVTLKGDYEGTKNIYFAILPKKMTISSVSKKKNYINIKWSKSNKANGYELAYKLKNSNEWIYISDLNSTNTKIYNYIKKQKYQFKVRAYYIINGQKHYTSWSKIKTKKIN